MKIIAVVILSQFSYSSNANNLQIVVSSVNFNNDAFELVENVDKMLRNVWLSNILTDGLFLNADVGFNNFVVKQSN